MGKRTEIADFNHTPWMAGRADCGQLENSNQTANNEVTNQS